LIRLLIRLLNIKDYEVCQSCETLKSQLAIANENNKELTGTLLALIKPKVFESPAVQIPPLQQSAIVFSKRREILEHADRKRSDILSTGKFIVKPDENKTSDPSKIAGDNQSISALEQELGLGDTDATQKSN